jgi:hypothetical protein
LVGIPECVHGEIFLVFLSSRFSSFYFFIDIAFAFGSVWFCGGIFSALTLMAFSPSLRFIQYSSLLPKVQLNKQKNFEKGIFVFSSAKIKFTSCKHGVWKFCQFVQ